MYSIPRNKTNVSNGFRTNDVAGNFCLNCYDMTAIVHDAHKNQR